MGNISIKIDANSGFGCTNCVNWSKRVTANKILFLVSLNRLTLKCLVLTVKSLEMLVLVVMIFSRSLVNHVYTCVLVRKGRVRTWKLSDVSVCKF